MLNNILFFVFFLVIIWLGAGLIVGSVDRLAKRVRVSSFALSFFILGILSSLPELAIGLSSISEAEPEIFVGNLLGGTIIIFLLIIPILAIFGGGIRIRHKLNQPVLLGILAILVVPNFLLLDKKITPLEAAVFIIAYFVSSFLIQKNYRLLDGRKTRFLSRKKYSFVDIAKVLVGVSLIFIASHFVVNEIIFFSDALNISSFLISAVILSVGTNIPEISLALKSIVSRKKDIAFGGYLGSATMNVFLMGFFSLLNNGDVPVTSNFFIAFLFITAGITLFYFFSRTKNVISRKEGLVLLGCYLLFLSIELVKSVFK